MQWVVAYWSGATLAIQCVRCRWSSNDPINLCALTHCQYNERVHRKEQLALIRNGKNLIEITVVFFLIVFQMIAFLTTRLTCFS